MSKVNIVGCGPGSVEYLLPPAKERIKNAEVLIGSQKTIELAEKISPNSGEKISIDKNLERVIKYIDENKDKKNITILLTGDPGFYSLFKLLKKKFPEEEFDVTPGLSSLQLAFAKLKDIWHDTNVLSLHGREENLTKLISHLKAGEKTAVLLGNMNTHELKEKLIENNIRGKKELTICRDLSLPGEVVIKTNLETLVKHPAEKDCLVIFPEETKPKEENTRAKIETAQNSTYQPAIIKDEDFIREDVPMTKEEIRTIIIAKLKLFPQAIVWDIGAGTGSISIQGAMHLNKEGKIYAIDYKNKALELIEKNKAKFNCSQVRLVPGEAPSVLKELPEPDRVIVGGSGNNINEILALLDNKESFKGPVVIPTIAYETFEKAHNYFRNNGNWKFEITSLQVNNLERHGTLSLWKSKNPVSIITAEKDTY